MSNYYENAYRRRLNRYGLDYQSRIQSQRERDFDNYLYKTIYRVDFEFEGAKHPGSLERYKQDYSETQGYLLTKIDLQLPNGTILMIESQNGNVTPWMVWWLEKIEASGYNRYIVLKMSHYLSWEIEGEKYEQWAYFYGPGASTIQDAIKSSSGKPVYTENNNLYMFITPYNDKIEKNIYFEVTQGETRSGYVVSQMDIGSTPGVAYVSIDPVPLREKTEVPKDLDKIPEEDSFWLQGGYN